jgi:tetratricopeptide (TPR) repeat protein
MQKRAGMRVVVMLAVGSAAASGQGPAPGGGRPADRASAYYHYALGHMYAELAGVYSRSDYVNQAIDNLKLAMKADPYSPEIAEELSEVYIQFNRLRDAQNDAEAALKLNPNDLGARRMLARVYLRQIGDPRRSGVDETMLRRAIEQFQRITELDSRDVSSWLMLGRLQKVSQNSAESEKAYQKVLELEPDNEDALNGLALVYADLGDHKSAAELWKRAADKRPSASSLQTLAGAYEQMRQYGLAAETLARALELNPVNADELRRAMAEDLRLAGRYADAIRVYEGLVAQDTGDSQSWLRLSQIYLRLRDTQKAREASDKARAIDPASIEIRYHDVNILEAEGKTGEAIQSLREVLSSTEKRSYNQGERANRLFLLERLGLLQREALQTEPAVDSFRQMIQLDPEAGPRASAQIVETYRQAKEFGKAQQEADAADKRWPNDQPLRLVRAALRAEMGSAPEAANDVRKLLNGKDDREVHIALAQIYDKGRLWAEMARELDQAEKLSETNEEKENVWFMRGAMFERMKDIESAEREFRKVLANSPDNAGALNYLSYMFADRNMKLPEALELIRKALELEPFNGAYLDTLGWLYYRMGRMEEAEDYLLRALARVPRDPTMLDHLGEVLFQRNKFREAVVQWEASLREWQASSPADLDPEEIAKVRNKLDAARRRVANAR